MTNLLQRGLGVLGQALAANAGETATLRRGSMSCDVTVLPARPLAMVDGNPVALAYDGLDFLFLDPTELILAGRSEEPKAGDEIEFTFGRETAIYEVFPVRDRQAYEAEANGTRWRVRTKKVRVVT
jgi:hypothetical protein